MHGDLAPYILAAVGLLIAVVGWIAKTVIAQGKELTAVRVAFNCYLEGIGKAAARVLDSPNPAPPHIRQLLRLYQVDELDAEGKQELRHWLEEAVGNEQLPKSERNGAYTLLVSMEARRLLAKAKHQ